MRRRVIVPLVLVAAIAVVIGVVLATQSSPSPGAASAGSHQSGSATVERRDLVESDTESGTLSYAGPQTVYDRLSGTITWLPAVGQMIKPGEPLYKVDGAPVILMNGATPAYRDLGPSDSDGPDILELNRNLIALGFDPDGIVADDVWQAATTAGVDVFQQFEGETVTGDLTLGQVVFLPGAQLISTVETTLGSNGSGGAGAAANADAIVTPARPEFVSLTSSTSTTSTPSSTSTTPSGRRGKKVKRRPETIAALIALLKAEALQLQAATAELKHAQSSAGSGQSGSGSSKSGSSSSKSGSSSASSGSSASKSGSSGGGSATAILATTSSQLVVTVDLDASKQSEAKLGARVTVEMPAGNTVNGTITAVSPVAQSSSSGSGSGAGGGGGGGGGGGSSSGATVPVTVSLDSRQSGAGLDQAAVSVNFAQAEAKGVLSIPVTALLATAGGGYAVQAAAAPHNLIPVTTGLFAAGYVQISGPSIYQGLEVTDSQG